MSTHIYEPKLYDLKKCICYFSVHLGRSRALCALVSAWLTLEESNNTALLFIYLHISALFTLS